MRVKTANQKNFAKTVEANLPRSRFHIPFTHNTSFNCGKIVPLYLSEVYPGDTFNINQSFVSRLTTPLFPTMDDLYIELHSFYVPYRLVWDKFVNLMGENTDSAWTPENPPDLVPVYDSVGDAGATQLTVSKKLGDYFGITPGTDLAKYPVSALHYRAYALIWNEWYRDENLQAPIPLNTSSTMSAVDLAYGPNADLFSANKYHDYFTSCLPQPQKGDSPLIPIELNELIPVVTGSRKDGVHTPLTWKSGTGTNIIPAAGYADVLSVEEGGNTQVSVKPLSDYPIGFYAYPDNLWADARGMRINSTTLQELRNEIQVLRILERDARGGTRFVELLKSHFNVDAGDYRLQRPEFLGSYKTLVGMQSVPQTSSTDATSPQGNLAAYSLTGGHSSLINKSFVEHGVVFVFAVARQVKTYQQGMERFMFRRDRLDFYWPELARISEQPVYKKEIYSLGNDGDDVFGYQEAWADLRWKPNRCSSQMRSGVSNSYDTWHYADVYNSTPTLSSSWIVDNSATNVDRTLAISMAYDDQIKMQITLDNIATRPLPTYSIPGLMDHF